MRPVLEFIPMLIWFGLWLFGGWLLTAALFRLRRGETAMAGVAIGLPLQVWLANLLAHVVPIVPASWLAAALVGATGAGCWLRLGRPGLLRGTWQHWVVLGFLTLIFTLIGRGLAIFDDYQNLPTVSLMATGDVPPHFALNPALNFGYHYFLLLFSAQLMRLGDMFPWTALDVARGLIMALPLILAALWGRRMLHSQLGAALTGGMMAFAGGARWLLLFLPQPILKFVSDNVTLIGSGATTAPNLAEALLTYWKIDGDGPIPFPFAFYTGINQPFVMLYTGISGSSILILLALLLTANRRRHWAAWLVASALVAALAIANEIAFLLLMLGFLIVGIIWVLQNRSLGIPRELRAWAGALAGSALVAALQGGLLTEILRARFAAAPGQSGYFDTSLSFVWPPAIVSAHLGSLAIVNLPQLLAALAEIGPVILVTPLLWFWARKVFRMGNWYEAALIAASTGALLGLFIAFQGPLYTATPRLMGGWFLACILYGVPLLWTWVRRRSGSLQVAAAVGILVSCLSGLLLFGVQLLAIQRPVLATFITPLDAKMSQDYWNRLEPHALIFDPVVSRSPTVFGRFTLSSPSWYTSNPDWQALEANPDPRSIRAAGFEYIYINRDYWDALTPVQQAQLSASCVRQVAEVEGIHSERNYAKDWRRLLDIKDCK